MIPFLDVGASYRELQTEIDTAIRGVLLSGEYILSPEVEAFENEYAAFVGARQCVGVASGLDALRLALQAFDIGPGDEVIVPANTFIATWLAVTQNGAVVVPVEPDEETYNLDPALIEEAITGRTRAIVPVHLYGQPADLGPIEEVARRHGLPVIEDAAQAHGARYDGARIGAGQDAVAWSFYPGKNLGAFGDGGAITTDNDEVADRLRRIRNYGSARKYEHEELGTNSRLDSIQAAVLRVKLRYLEDWNRRREAVAARYLDQIQSSLVSLPHVHEMVRPSWHLFVVRSAQRDSLARHIGERGVRTMIHYPVAPHLQLAYAGMGLDPGAFPTTERIQSEILSLPIGPHMTSEQQGRVVDAVDSWASSNN